MVTIQTRRHLRRHEAGRGEGWCPRQAGGPLRMSAQQQRGLGHRWTRCAVRVTFSGPRGHQHTPCRQNVLSQSLCRALMSNFELTPCSSLYPVRAVALPITQERDKALAHSPSPLAPELGAHRCQRVRSGMHRNDA